MTRHHICYLVIVLSSFSLFASASDRSETLRAINIVENPTNQTGYGSKGELGPYQFRSSTWRMHTNKPFRMANDRVSADQVAVMHYELIKERLTAVGIDANSYNIALAWNCGISAVLNGRVPMQTYYYAERVNNLAEDFHQAVAEVEPETSLQVIVTTKPATAASGMAFNLSDRSAAPELKIVSEPFRFRVGSDTSRFVLTPVQPRFSLVSN